MFDDVAYLYVERNQVVGSSYLDIEDAMGSSPLVLLFFLFN
jgi:hypothetical protein